MENKVIRVFGRERQTQDGKNKFIAWSYTKDGETYYEVKFTQECTTQPKKPGYWLLTLNPKDCSIQHRKSKKDDLFKPNDVLWIDNVIDCKHDEEYEKLVAQRRLEEVNDIL